MGPVPPAGSRSAPARLRASALLRARGLRVTGPRVEVLAFLLTAEEGHVSADALIERAAAAEPPVHRATVYRTLEGLTLAGVLGHVHLSVGPPTYRLAAAPDAADPADLVSAAARADRADPPDDLLVQCVECGRIAAVPATTWGGTAERVRLRTGFVLDPTHVALAGRCPDCVEPSHAEG